MQRVVASKMFHHSPNWKFSCTMVENSDNDDATKQCNLCFPSWISKLLLLLKFLKRYNGNGVDTSESNSTEKLLLEKESGYKELCLVQWYKIMYEKIMKSDWIHEVLSFIWLQWQRTSKNVVHLSVCKKHGLIFTNSIWGLLHAVRRASLIREIQSTFGRIQVICSVLGVLECWEADQFYINKFHFFETYSFISEEKLPALHKHSSKLDCKTSDVS